MSYFFELISNRRHGWPAQFLRAVLHALSLPYRLGVSLRNTYYDLNWGVKWVERPCISIGNITTGGTGKTPVVGWLADALIRRGKKVAIISRGYKGRGGMNDEVLELSSRYPQALCVAHPDRLHAGWMAIHDYQADIILLDDAFQHRRCGRDLDIVLIDATNPFGYEHVLPRGLLREPLSQLTRAGVVIITRASLVAAQEVQSLKERCSVLAPHAQVLACNHLPVGLTDLNGNSKAISELAGKRILAFAGIGNPPAFERTIRELGTKALTVLIFSDHHPYRRSDCERISEQAQLLGADLLLTTVKDLVKLRGLPFDWPVSLEALEIRIDFIGPGGKILLRKVDELFM